VVEECLLDSRASRNSGAWAQVYASPASWSRDAICRFAHTDPHAADCMPIRHENYCSLIALYLTSSVLIPVT
jgi:hypothetical protein